MIFFPFFFFWIIFLKRGKYHSMEYLSSIEHCWMEEWLWHSTIFVILDAWVSRQAGHLNKRITNDGRSLTNRRRSTIGNIYCFRALERV